MSAVVQGDDVGYINQIFAPEADAEIMRRLEVG